MVSFQDQPYNNFEGENLRNRTLCSPSLLKSERCQTLGKSHIKIFPTTPTFCSSFLQHHPYFQWNLQIKKWLKELLLLLTVLQVYFYNFTVIRKVLEYKYKFFFSQFYDIFCLFFVFQLEIQHQPCFGLKNPAQAFICPLPHMAM